MSTVSKIIGALILSGSVFALVKANQEPEKKLSIGLGKMYRPVIKDGFLILTINVECINPTSKTFQIQKPVLIAYLKGEEVGRSVFNYAIPPLNNHDVTVLNGIIKIPFKKLGSYAVSLISGTIPRMGIEIEMITYVEGTSVPFTERKLFEI